MWKIKLIEWLNGWTGDWLMRHLPHDCGEHPYGTYTWQIHNRVNQRVGSGIRTMIDPQEDFRCMDAALELTQAIRLRNVPIDPYTLYKLVVGKPYLVHFDGTDANAFTARET